MQNWPALIFGLILTAYWGRVLRLVYKIRRKTGRSANFAPAEPLGMALRILWYPAVTTWVVYPYVVAFAHRLPPVARPLVSSPIAAWIAVGVGALALAGTLVCWKKMGKSWRMGINPGEKTELIVSGPYAYVRHPIYALSSVLMLATMVAIPSPLMLIAGLIHLLLLQWEARREERYLVAQHGQGYADYCRRVGRFMPRTWQAYRAGASACCD